LAEAALKIAAVGDNSSAAEFAFGVKSSFGGRPWRFRASDEEAARGLSLSGYSSALAQILAARGVTRDTVGAFLGPRLKTLLPEPFLLAGMERAVERFARALISRETIAVLGDYDVDGACASALLLRFVRALGGQPLLHIPDRMTEGYGPSVNAFRKLREQGAGVVVTVDCGAAAHDALSAAAAMGLDAIVLDHHAVEKNPPAFAHVNPNGPDDPSGMTYLCAAGLTFLFLVGVQRRLRQEGWFAQAGVAEVDLMNQLDVVALATVADVVPLLGVNRAFVKQGLSKLARLERPGFAALARVAAAEPPFDQQHLGFIFGPRINAGGRVGRCDLGARLLASDDCAEAHALALELDRHNRERQAIESGILDAADAMAAMQAERSFVLVTGDGWHAGVVGIVAGRLKDRHAKPVLVGGFESANTDAVARGSARSVPGVDLGAIIRAALAEGVLETGGGHAMAAGFSVRRDKVPSLEDFLKTRIEPQRDRVIAARDLILDAVLSASGATPELLYDLERAGPFGSGNPEPVFLLPDMLVAYADVVGTNHLRMRLVARDGAAISAIAFRAANTDIGRQLLKSRGQRVHAAGKLKRDDYNGESRVQLHLEDAAAAAA